MYAEALQTGQAVQGTYEKLKWHVGDKYWRAIIPWYLTYEWNRQRQTGFFCQHSNHLFGVRVVYDLLKLIKAFYTCVAVGQFSFFK